MDDHQNDQGSRLQEYIDVSNNLRHWNTLRFAELTVFIAFVAGLLSALYIGKAANIEGVGFLLKAAGLMSTLVFFFLQERTMSWFHAFLKRAVAIEAEIDFHQYRSMPRARVFTSQNSIRFLFLMILAFWVVVLLGQVPAV